MDDSDETARESGPFALDLAYEQGLINNEIKWICTLRRILGCSVEDDRRLPRLTRKHLEALSACLVEHVRGRFLPPQSAEDASRLKAARDRLWEFDSAYDEGRERVERVGFIRSFQEAVGLPPTPEEELNRLTLEQLGVRKDEVMRAARERASLPPTHRGDAK